MKKADFDKFAEGRERKALWHQVIRLPKFNFGSREVTLYDGCQAGIWSTSPEVAGKRRFYRPEDAGVVGNHP